MVLPLKRWGYPIRYVGKNRKPEYLINNKWTKYDQVPERKVYKRKHDQTEKGYFTRVFIKMKGRHNKRKEYWLGKFEFKNTQDLLNHWYKQKEEYGNKCPITHKPLTMIRYRGNGKFTGTNISPDRLSSPITYTKQNVLFTSATWNIKKGDSKFYELDTYFRKDLLQRFYKVLRERFPGNEIG